MEAVDWDEIGTLNPDNSNFLYKNSAVESVQIGNFMIEGIGEENLRGISSS